LKPLTIAEPITKNAVQQTPLYPSSSKNKKNCDKIDKEITKEESKDKPEGEAEFNALFKQIYETANENTRRAMIKSYQTSGGTVLSTNWNKVATKDYEGKDRPEAPEGQMWVKDK
jgi:suppressor of G2 allele of SKP1